MSATNFPSDRSGRPDDAAPDGVPPEPAAPDLAEPAAAGDEPERPKRRRGRVTRTAGAPTATVGDAPVAAVLTVPSAPEATSEPAAEPVPASVPAQAEPGPAVRPRRSRRAASRPAGPPVEAGGDPE